MMGSGISTPTPSPISGARGQRGLGNPPGAFNWGWGLWGGSDLDQLYQGEGLREAAAQPQGSGLFLSEKFEEVVLPGR